MNQGRLDTWEKFRAELIEVRRVQAAAGGSAPMDIGAFGRGCGGKGGGKEACQICKKKGHSAKDCWQRGKGRGGQALNLTGDYGGGSSRGG
eukprot:7767303-Karenia_brevis.AAC.1